MNSSTASYMDPRIGLLMRDGRTVHYAYTNGYAEPPFEGTRDQVERALGLRLADEDPTPAIKRKKVGKLRTFIVTVTPKHVVYTGSHIERESDVEVDAISHAKAISLVRRARSDEDGRYAVPALYRASLKAGE